MKNAPAVPKPPHKPWFGGLILGSLLLAIVWLLTYTLAPLPGQRSLHAWNYAITVALLAFFVGSASRWRGDPPDARSADHTVHEP